MCYFQVPMMQAALGHSQRQMQFIRDNATAYWHKAEQYSIKQHNKQDHLMTESNHSAIPFCLAVVMQHKIVRSISESQSWIRFNKSLCKLAILFGYPLLH